MPKRVQVTVPDELLESLTAEHEKLKISYSAIIISLVAEALGNREKTQALISLGKMVEAIPEDELKKQVVKHISSELDEAAQLTF